MTDIKNSKSLLAKLLASENITVSHQNTPTAYFDLKTRSLVCPVWKDMDGDLYDLLMGHEVGHALETPEQGWHNAVKDGDTKFKGFLNVIEDARIERKIKSRFPGLGRSFSAAYKSLWDRDFFGIKNIDIGELTLIDRINIRFKLGAHVHVPFNDEERAMIAEVETTETWEDVEALARRVYGYSKQNEQDKIQSMEDLKDAIQDLKNQESSSEDGEEESDEVDETDSEEEDFGDDDFGDDYDDYDDEDGEEDSSSSGDGEENDSDGASADDEEEAEETADGNSKHLGGLNDGEEKAESNDLESVTDTNFRQRESELVNDDGIISMFELPDADLSKIIINNNVVINDLEAWLRTQTQSSDIYRNHNISYDKVVEKCVRKFTRNNNKFVMHLVKEFEMRKKASQYARQQTAKTGELDMNVLHKYKFSSDLFKKVTVVPRGKNHGMILFMDMSGSMSNIMRNTLEQLLVLVSFCKTVRIPFDVYGFSDDMYTSLDRQTSIKIASSNNAKFKTAEPNTCKVHGHYFHLKHLIGSSLSPTAMRRAFNTLCVVVNEYSAGYGIYQEKDCGFFERNWDKSGFGLNGTPFVHTLLASREIINNFRAAHKLDVTNVVYLTDGEGGDGLSCPDGQGMYNGRKLGVVYLVDKKTKKKVRIEDWSQQSAVTSLVRDVTGCKHIGFYLVEQRSVRWVMRDMASKFDAVKRSKLLKQMREDKFFAIPNLGYDNYFYIEAADQKITEEGIGDLTGMTKAKITSAFKKSMNSKKSSRALVSQFAKEIAAGGLVA